MESLLAWQESSLGNYVDLLTGFPFKSEQFTDGSSDIPLVKGANVHQGYIDWNSAKNGLLLNSANIKNFSFSVMM